MMNLLACEMPYEKLDRFGAANLTDVELLAILLRTGTREKSPLDLARELLALADGFRQIGKLSLSELQTIKGIGKVKAIQIKAILEIAKRYQKEAARSPRVSNSFLVFSTISSIFPG